MPQVQCLAGPYITLCQCIDDFNCRMIGSTGILERDIDIIRIVFGIKQLVSIERSVPTGFRIEPMHDWRNQASK
jgi:hypothetical protein